MASDAQPKLLSESRSSSTLSAFDVECSISSCGTKGGSGCLVGNAKVHNDLKRTNIMIAGTRSMMVRRIIGLALER